jgi:hypothetical protein
VRFFLELERRHDLIKVDACMVKQTNKIASGEKKIISTNIKSPLARILFTKDSYKWGMLEN